MTEIDGDGYPYGYKKLTASLQEDYNPNINHKKSAPIMQGLGLLLPQRGVVPKHPRKLAKKK
jgi:putative transposase